jgi:hypothetical protein
MQHLSSKQASPSPAAGLWRIVGCLTPEQTRRFTREIKLVSGKFMGHASITITIDRYGHLLPGGEADAIALLDTYHRRTESK